MKVLIYKPLQCAECWAILNYNVQPDKSIILEHGEYIREDEKWPCSQKFKKCKIELESMEMEEI